MFNEYVNLHQESSTTLFAGRFSGLLTYSVVMLGLYQTRSKGNLEIFRNCKLGGALEFKGFRVQGVG